MSELNLDQINRWVESTDLDQSFSRLEEDDPDWFEHQICCICDDNQMLVFASNRNSQKRSYFASLLVRSLFWVYLQQIQLPYNFSRMEGILSLDQYLDREKERLTEVYKKSEILEKMRTSDLEEIRDLSRLVLDYRHDRLVEKSYSYSDFFRNIESEISEKFKAT